MKKNKWDNEWRRRLFYIIKILLLGFLLYAEYYETEIKNQIILYSKWFEAIIFYITSILIVSTARIALVAIYKRRARKSRQPASNFIIGINRISSIISFVILLASVLLLFNVNLGEFLTSISIVAAAIAIISKDYVANVINGLILMFSDQVSINDHIVIGDVSGRITDITFINTVILNEEDEIVYVPNTTMLTTNILNITNRQLKKFSFDFQIDALKKVDFEQLESEILEGIKHEFSAEEFQDYNLRIMHIKRDLVHFKVQMLIEANNKHGETQMRRAIQTAILKYNDAVR